MYDELNIAFRDPGVVAELETHFLADLEDAHELDLTAWRARPRPGWAAAKSLSGRPNHLTSRTRLAAS